MLRLPLRLLPKDLPAVVLQGPLRGKRWIVGAGTHGCWLGSYEFDKQRAFAQRVRSGDTIYDIGANVGFYTLLAATLGGASGRVVAFEPAPRNLQYLKRHLRLNRVTNVTVVEAAVADQKGTASFDEGPVHSEGRLADCGRLRVDVVTVDDLVNGEKLPAPDCLKIDVEGAEFRVLQGAAQTLAARHPIVFLATHGSEVHRACCELLAQAGYTLGALAGSGAADSDEILAEYKGAR